MAHALWTGSISFGLVNIPVRLYAATDSHQLEFHQYDAKSGKRIRYKRVSEGTDEEVAYEQIVDGYEVTKGKIVTLSDEEMAAAEPKKTHTLDLEDFVPLESIDPVMWNHTYYVGPDDSAGAQKAYAVLREAMRQMKRVGVGRFVMRSKEYLATIRPIGQGIALETMFFEDEIRDLKEVPHLGDQPAVSARETELAKKLIEGLSGEWDHGKYKDTYRDQLLAVIKQKAKGKTIDTAPPEKEGGQVIDLMEALKLSLAKRGGSGANASGTKTSGAKASGAKTPAERRPSRRAPPVKKGVRKKVSAKRRAG